MAKDGHYACFAWGQEKLAGRIAERRRKLRITAMTTLNGPPISPASRGRQRFTL